jgi:hypothetical protein
MEKEMEKRQILSTTCIRRYIHSPFFFFFDEIANTKQGGKYIMIGMLAVKYAE